MTTEPDAEGQGQGQLQPGLYWALPVGAYVRGMFDDKATIVEWDGQDFFVLGDETNRPKTEFRVVSERLVPPPTVGERLYLPEDDGNG